MINFVTHKYFKMKVANTPVNDYYRMQGNYLYMYAIDSPCMVDTFPHFLKCSVLYIFIYF